MTTKIYIDKVQIECDKCGKVLGKNITDNSKWAEKKKLFPRSDGSLDYYRDWHECKECSIK